MNGCSALTRELKLREDNSDASKIFLCLSALTVLFAWLWLKVFIAADRNLAKGPNVLDKHAQRKDRGSRNFMNLELLHWHEIYRWLLYYSPLLDPIHLRLDARDGLLSPPQWSITVLSNMARTLARIPHFLPPREKMSLIVLGHPTHQPINLSSMAYLAVFTHFRSPTRIIGEAFLLPVENLIFCFG